MFHFTTVSEVSCIRKCRCYGAIGVEPGVPAAMIEVQVTVDDDVDLVRPYARGCQGMGEEFLITMDVPHLWRLLVADAGLDQHCLAAGSHDDGIQTENDTVLAVGG